MPSPPRSPKRSEFGIVGCEDTTFQIWDQMQSQSSTSRKLSLGEQSSLAHGSISHPLVMQEDDSLVKDFQHSETEFPLDASFLSKDGLGSEEDQCEVLVHELQASDSLPGLAIRYGVPIANIRKVNKLWSSDSVHLRKTLFIPIANPTRGFDGSKASQYATIRRVPTKDFAFFPPGRTNPEKFSNNLPLDESASERGIISNSPSGGFSQILKSFPRTETLLSRLSFDSRNSSLSDEHELQELNIPRNSKEFSDSLLDEARTPMASRKRHSLPTDYGDPCPRLNLNDTFSAANFDERHNDPIVTVQTQPKPFPPMSLSVASTVNAPEEGFR